MIIFANCPLPFFSKWSESFLYVCIWRSYRIHIYTDLDSYAELELSWYRSPLLLRDAAQLPGTYSCKISTNCGRSRVREVLEATELPVIRANCRCVRVVNDIAVRSVQSTIPISTDLSFIEQSHITKRSTVGAVFPAVQQEHSWLAVSQPTCTGEMYDTTLGSLSHVQYASDASGTVGAIDATHSLSYSPCISHACTFRHSAGYVADPFPIALLLPCAQSRHTKLANWLTHALETKLYINNNWEYSVSVAHGLETITHNQMQAT